MKRRRRLKKIQLLFSLDNHDPTVFSGTKQKQKKTTPTFGIGTYFQKKKKKWYKSPPPPYPAITTRFHPSQFFCPRSLHPPPLFLPPSQMDQYSAGQCAFALGYVGILVLWAYAEYLELRASDALARVYDTELNEITAPSPLGSSSADAQHENKDDEGASSAPAAAAAGGAAAQEESSVPANTSSSSSSAVDIPVPLPPSPSSALSVGGVLRSVVSTHDNPVWNMVRMHPPALVAHRLELRDAAEFGAHLCFYFFCDRTSVMPPPGEKHYSRDLFWFIYAILIAYNVAHYVEKTHAANYLNRDQTEEWKGWMQILFLMYHYFNAGEQYNSIRLYIAAYVWMTGFGNFSFYYVRKDFSPARFFQMLWRLNFLVFWVCVVMNNDYMLYYICPMHTIWTVFVYFILRIGNKYNDNGNVIMLKVALSVAVVYVGWANADAFYAVWRPLSPLVQYVDPNPKNPGLVQEPLHEWFFRSGLDRYVWIFGMLCANFHPTTEKFLLWMDSLPQAARFGARSVFTGTLLTIGVYWYRSFMVLDRREYNTWHPYTSFIPIGIYILLRNLTPTLREWSLTYFSFLGKITLETYIGQFHIWLHTGVANGQPRTLLTLVPDYPLMNFFVVTPLYLWISYRLFHLTNTLKLDILPSKDNPRLYRNLLLTAATWTCIYICGRLIKSFA
eukprot:Rhum_TRINITY_DN13870_c0_g1::Rhum_TRINITY_DN13870_c0_g1_i2::g.65222::m.65222